MFWSVYTRSDIAYTLNYLSKYNNDALEIGIELKRVLCYLRGTINRHLCFGGKNKQNRMNCEPMRHGI